MNYCISIVAAITTLLTSATTYAGHIVLYDKKFGDFSIIVIKEVVPVERAMKVHGAAAIADAKASDAEGVVLEVFRKDQGENLVLLHEVGYCNPKKPKLPDGREPEAFAVHLEGDILILVYRLGSAVLADVVNYRQSKLLTPIGHQLGWSPPNGLPAWLETAEITGSLKAHTLRLTLTWSSSDKYRVRRETYFLGPVENGARWVEMPEELVSAPRHVVQHLLTTRPSSRPTVGPGQ